MSVTATISVDAPRQARGVARRVIEAADEHLTPLKLMKLVYLCHGWSLVHLKTDLLREEIEAWQYGPVIPDLYQAIRNFRAQPVPAEILPNVSLSQRQQSLISSVYSTYKPYTGAQLSALTHNTGTPWHRTWNNGRGRNATIQTAMIRDHFQELANK